MNVANHEDFATAEESPTSSCSNKKARIPHRAFLHSHSEQRQPLIRRCARGDDENGDAGDDGVSWRRRAPRPRLWPAERAAATASSCADYSCGFRRRNKVSTRNEPLSAMIFIARPCCRAASRRKSRPRRETSGQTRWRSRPEGTRSRLARSARSSGELSGSPPACR